MSNSPDPQEILEAYSKVTGVKKSNEEEKYGSTILKRTHYRTAPLTDHEQVLDSVREFAPRQGWLCFQSEIFRIDGDQISLPTDAGHVISGELVTETNANRSLHIKYVDNQWHLTLISEIDNGTDLSANDDAIPVIFKRTCQLIDKDEVASYRVYYQYDAATYRPFCYRFTGFEANASANKV